MPPARRRSEEHTSEPVTPENLVCRLLLEKKKKWPHWPHNWAIPEHTEVGPSGLDVASRARFNGVSRASPGGGICLFAVVRIPILTGAVALCPNTTLF